MDKDGWTWQWFWFGGGALMLSALTTVRGYLRSRNRDRIADLESEVSNLRKDVETLKRAHELCQSQLSSALDENLRLMRLLVASDARDVRRDEELKRRGDR